MAYVDDKKLIKKMKNKNAYWFDSTGLTSIVLKRYDGEFAYQDLSADNTVFHHWVNKNSLKEVEDLTAETYKIQEQLRQPMLVLFVNFEHPDPKVQKASYHAREVMKQIAPKYNQFIGIMVANNN